MKEWIPLRVHQDPSVLRSASPDLAMWRAWVLETFGPVWDTCASCGESIRPPEQFYEHGPTRQRAHVRCTRTDVERARRIEHYRDLLAAAIVRAQVAGNDAMLTAVIMGGDPGMAYKEAFATVWEGEQEALDAYLP